jgi:hypothetical protein
MENGALATKGPKMSLPHKKLIKKPGGLGKAAKTWKSAPGHERQGRKNMEKRPVATKGPTMSLPHKKSIKDPGEAWQGTKNM